MPRPSILVTYKLPAAAIATLESIGHVDVPSGVLTREDLLSRVKGKDALVVVDLMKVDQEVIDAAPDLKIIANVGVGFNNIDVAYARSKNLIVTNTPDALNDATANLAIALILAATRRIGEAERLLRRGDWKGMRFDFMVGSDVRNKQLGIVGMGRVGALVAEKASALGMRIAYYSRNQRSLPQYQSMTLDQLISTSDVLSLHVPLTPETRHLIDRTALSRMKRSAYLINTARGPVVDEEALVWALKENIIKGAGLDVYENEPAIHPGLLALENVVMFPHLGSATDGTRLAMADLAARNVVNVLNGQPPITPV